MADVFVNVKEKTFTGEEAQGTQYTNFGAIAIGNGAKVFRGDSSGIWLGAEKWADAPFRVDMDGNVVASSITITGYVPTGGAAADVNAGVTTINAAKINISGSTNFSAGYDPSLKVDETGGIYTTTATAAASKVQIFPDSNTGIVAYASDGTSVVFRVLVGGTNVGDVQIGNYSGSYGLLWDQSAATLYIKGDIVAGNISADRITSGTLSTSRIPNLSADKITTGTLDADRIDTGSITASKLNVSTLSAITSNMGTLTAGTISAGTILLNGVSLSGSLGIGGGGVQPSNLIIAYSSSSGAGTGAYLRFGSASGSRIWSDSSGRIGINSLGVPMYIYVDSYEKIVIYDNTSQTIFRHGISCDGALNVVSGYAARFPSKIYTYGSGTTQYIDSDADDQRYWSSDNHEFYKGGVIKAIIDDNIWTDGTYYEGCSAFVGEPFSILETVKGEITKSKDSKLIPLDHKKLHPLLKRNFKTKDGVEHEVMSLSDLVKVQNKAIMDMNERIINIEKGIK